ncbi:fatty acid desaturase family protein [Archangium primigenium]|uniref:fatty acid desaturase family protein n=1 Tax=[Archangium] primigenium TaxID=2792470 RepID=UPI0019591E7D|nr:fatty acid desaturase [Archangium primigenium]MBM7114513.1 fatty acid desaturase [Archangium primigenium]
MSGPSVSGAGVPPRPPGTLNVCLALGIVAGGVGLQWLASRAEGTATLLGLGVAFSFLFLPLYSLLHEAEHRVFHVNPRVNEGFGLLLAAFFPGPFTFLRACHLGHHRRNRSDAEMFDLYYPSDNRTWKRVYFYFLYTGGFWLAVPLAVGSMLVWPGFLRGQVIKDPSTVAMLHGIPEGFFRRIRLECAGVVLLHAALIGGLGLSPGRYLLLYALYGVNWSAQQYITHAASPRHVLDGAHNLRAWRGYEVLLLHFNWHLAHHQHPRVPWLYLPRYDDASRTRPGYLTSFLRFWRGPRLTEPLAQAPGLAGTLEEASAGDASSGERSREDWAATGTPASPNSPGSRRAC